LEKYREFKIKKEITSVLLSDDCAVDFCEKNITVETYGFKLIIDLQQKKATILRKRWLK